MNETTSVPVSSRLRPTLDVIATLMVIAAAAAVITLAVEVWRERRADINSMRENAPQSPAPALTPPAKPQQISGAPTIGSRDAPVAIIEYADFQCPYCAQHFKNVWPGIKKTYVDTGKVRLVFKHLPLESHPHSRSAALGAECASQQGRFSEMHELLFASSAALSSDTSIKAAQQLGLDVSRFDKCLNGEGGLSRLQSDIDDAKAIGVVATPWFLVGTVTDRGLVDVKRVLVGMTSLEEFEAAIKYVTNGE